MSPLNEVRRVLDYAVTEIPPEKILMGMPNYGYDWMLPYASGTAARTVGFVEAIELAQRFGSEIIFDERSQTPYFNYVENGVRHVGERVRPRRGKLLDDQPLLCAQLAHIAGYVRYCKTLNNNSDGQLRYSNCPSES